MERSDWLIQKALEGLYGHRRRTVIGRIKNDVINVGIYNGNVFLKKRDRNDGDGQVSHADERDE